MSTELVKPTATQSLAIARNEERSQEVAEIVSTLREWDKDLAMNVYLLCKKKFKGKQGATKQLEPYQAVAFAKYCQEEGLNAWGNEAFYDTDNDKPGTTLEGKKRKSRDRGYNFGPPVFTFDEREWPKGKPKIMGFDRDLACICTMELVGFSQPATYTAWLSEWYVSSNPNWVQRTRHMLQVRAQEKALSMSSGVGVSEQLSELQIEDKPMEAVVETPTIVVKEVEVKPV
jgi:hypothetical protein